MWFLDSFTPLSHITVFFLDLYLVRQLASQKSAMTCFCTLFIFSIHLIRATMINNFNVNY